MYKLPQGYQATDRLDGFQLELDLDYNYGGEGEVLPTAISESLRELRKREGCCEDCGTTLPMTWMGLAPCPRCKK